MAKEKNKPVPVRFNLKLLEVLKEEEKIDTPQQALNFLADFWENHRPAKDDFENELRTAQTQPTPLPIPKTKKEGPKKNAGDVDEAPAGLFGIDLSIWKAEQKERNKNA